ncbi:MAG: diguanylate cyclase, partial [Phycisphaerae bacterium]|nr:diguanylate cyclase [Phycisphaerae bacterium]
LAEDLRQRIAGLQFEHEGVPYSVTISQGLAEWPSHGQTIEQIIAAADGALYAAAEPLHRRRAFHAWAGPGGRAALARAGRRCDSE